MACVRENDKKFSTYTVCFFGIINDLMSYLSVKRRVKSQNEDALIQGKSIKIFHIQAAADKILLVSIGRIVIVSKIQSRNIMARFKLINYWKKNYISKNIYRDWRIEYRKYLSLHRWIFFKDLNLKPEL